MNNLSEWAIRHGVSQEAMRDLYVIFGLDGGHTIPIRGISEQAVKAAIRLEASQFGAALWVNNVGAYIDSRGVQVRYGLANDSKQLNERFKSSDLIGIRPINITQAHVGSIIGQFVARECKEPNWKYTGTGREVAQLNYLTFISYLGGDAMFATGTGTI